MFCRHCGSQMDMNGRCPRCDNRPQALRSSNSNTGTGLAIASLVLGLLSVLLGILTAIPGIICGILALKQPRTDPNRGNHLAVTGIIFNISGLILGVVYIVMFVNTVREGLNHLGGEMGLEPAAKKMLCMGKLANIDMMCKLYAEDNKGYLPPEDGIDKLKKYLYKPDADGNLSYRLNRSRGLNHSKAGDIEKQQEFFFICPAYMNMKMEKIGDSEKAELSYIYFGGFKKLNAFKRQIVKSNIPVLFDRPGNHNGYVNVVYLGGEPGSLLTEANDCRELIEDFNKKFNYSPEVLATLRAKAAVIDTLYKLPDSQSGTVSISKPEAMSARDAIESANDANPLPPELLKKLRDKADEIDAENPVKKKK